MNLREQFRLALLARGYTEASDATSRNYVILVSPKGERRVYLGKGGAVRVGRTIADSRPLGGAAKKILLEK